MMSVPAQIVLEPPNLAALDRHPCSIWIFEIDDRSVSGPPQIAGVPQMPGADLTVIAAAAANESVAADSCNLAL
jgi:hypothetical protein